jgi:FtsH-binding integral membrane protein
METNVFERKLSDEQTGELISTTRYNLVIGVVLLWGFVINWAIVQFVPVLSIQSIDPVLFLLGYFAPCCFGMHLISNSMDPWKSFIGYNFIVLPVGLVINIAVSHFDSSLVLDAMRITGLVTLLMMALGTSFPKFFEKIIGTITVALLAVIIVELVEIFLLGIHPDVLDWLIALIFCGYIGYDWGRANKIPKTTENAIECAAALYLDMINLFLRILSLLSDEKNSD